jgi:hypothetical protein
MTISINSSQISNFQFLSSIHPTQYSKTQDQILPKKQQKEGESAATIVFAQLDHKSQNSIFNRFLILKKPKNLSELASSTL